MNILFLTITHITNINERGIYTDLMRQFRDMGHKVYIVSPGERRYKQPTALMQQEGISLLKVKTLNLQKTNVIEKGTGTVLLEYQFLSAIKRHFNHIRFDLVLYSTPPITFTRVVKMIKQCDSAKTYLLLKDIFPQNAVDLGLIKQGGLLHRFFVKKEKALYQISDVIGCMSPANRKYLQTHHSWIDHHKVEVNPNSITLSRDPVDSNVRQSVLCKYNLLVSKTVFIYGGNLGKPQGIDFLLETIESCHDIPDAFFLIVGGGTEYPRVNQWFERNKPSNARLINLLPKDEYDALVAACDVGLIFLDPRFTIPNFPSRLLSYLEFRMPVITATDAVTDIGTIAEANNFGFKVISGQIELMKKYISMFCDNTNLVAEMGENAFRFLTENYTSKHSYDIIMNHFPPPPSESQQN